MRDFLLSNKAGHSSAAPDAPACPGGEWTGGSWHSQHSWAPHCCPPLQVAAPCHIPVPHVPSHLQRLCSPLAAAQLLLSGQGRGLSFPGNLPCTVLRSWSPQSLLTTLWGLADGASWALTPLKQPPANGKSTLEPALSFYFS